MSMISIVKNQILREIGKDIYKSAKKLLTPVSKPVSKPKYEIEFSPYDNVTMRRLEEIFQSKVSCNEFVPQSLSFCYNILGFQCLLEQVLAKVDKKHHEIINKYWKYLDNLYNDNLDIHNKFIEKELENSTKICEVKIPSYLIVFLLQHLALGTTILPFTSMKILNIIADLMLIILCGICIHAVFHGLMGGLIIGIPLYLILSIRNKAIFNSNKKIINDAIAYKNYLTKYSNETLK